MKKSLIIMLGMVSLAVMTAQVSSASNSVPLPLHVGESEVAHLADGGSMFLKADPSALNSHKSLEESVKASLQQMIFGQTEPKAGTGKIWINMAHDEEEDSGEEGEDGEDEEEKEEKGEGWDRQWDAPKLA